MLVVELDDEDCILRIEERLNGKEPSKTWITSAVRRFNGRSMNWIVNVPQGIVGHQSSVT